MAISLDSNISDRLNAGMNDNQGAQLPFAAPYVWALNGQANMKQANDPTYFGGWAAKADEFEAAADEQGLGLPAGWKKVTLSGRDGDEYEAVVIRHIFVAPILYRECWRKDEDNKGPARRSPKYFEGARRNVQALVYLSEKSEAGMIPWGPVVLTAKGYQAEYLKDAFKAWEKHTATLRRTVAPGVPAWCFYLAIGTFGKERQAQNVGKGNNKSPVTPISAYLPADLSEAKLEALFVGQEIAAIMADLAEQAQAWAADWGQPEKPAELEGEGDDLTPPDFEDPVF